MNRISLDDINQLKSLAVSATEDPLGDGGDKTPPTLSMSGGGESKQSAPAMFRNAQ